MLTKGDGTWFLITWWRTTSCLGVATTKNYHLRSFLEHFHNLTETINSGSENSGCCPHPLCETADPFTSFKPPGVLAPKILWQIVMASCASWRRPWRDWERNPWPQSLRPFLMVDGLGYPTKVRCFFFFCRVYPSTIFVFFCWVFFLSKSLFKRIWFWKMNAIQGVRNPQILAACTFSEEIPPKLDPGRSKALWKNCESQSTYMIKSTI